MRVVLAIVCLALTSACGPTPAASSFPILSSGPPIVSRGPSAPPRTEPASGSAQLEPIGWQPIAPAPLSARYGASAFWTGTLVYVVGGSDDDTCPPTADCAGSGEPPLADGAVYDPATDTWSALPVAPVPLGHMSGAVIDDRLYVWVAGLERGAGVRAAFLSVRAGDEAWAELAAPPIGQLASIGLTAAGGQVLAYQGSHEQGWRADLIYDPATDGWQELPADPLAPSFDRQVVWTEAGPVLLAAALVPDPGSQRPSLLRAALLDLDAMVWRTLPDSDILCCGGPWHWTGGRLVNASIANADGGQTNNWGREYPYGGILDPVAGGWDRLPNPPAHQGPRTGLSAGGGGWVVGLDGWALNLDTFTWFPIPDPPVPTDGGPADVWAGDRLFAWGGYRVVGGRTESLDVGWTWAE